MHTPQCHHCNFFKIQGHSPRTQKPTPPSKMQRLRSLIIAILLSTPASEMKKEIAGGGGVAASSCSFEMRPIFVVTMVVLTLFVMAVWQLPYPLGPTTLPALPEKKKLLSSSSQKVVDSLIHSVSTVAAANPDPNKRQFQAYGNAAALFVQIGAYRGGAATFAVVGLASKPAHVFGKPWFKCEWVPHPSSPSNHTVRTKAYKILPDWGYGRVYTVVVVNCTFPGGNPNLDNAGGRLLLHAFYGESPRRYEKFVALEEAPGEYDPARFRPPHKYEYLYCGSSLYGELNPARIREWIAYHAWFFGPRSHFVFHDAGGVGPAVQAVLEPWVRAGRATVHDIRSQAEYDGYYYNQFLVVNDCLHRYRFAANWTFYFDVDEYIYLPEGNTLESVVSAFSDYTQFTIQQNPMSSKLCLRDEAKNFTRQWGFEKLVFREARTGIRRDRKYAIQAKNAFATGVHMSENVVGKTLHKTEDKIRYYHYHDSITVAGEPCRVLIPMPAPPGNATWFDKLPFVYDPSMRRLAAGVKLAELAALRSPPPP